MALLLPVKRSLDPVFPTATPVGTTYRDSFKGTSFGAGWVDAHTSRPTEFDAFEFDDGDLVGVGTVPSTWAGPSDLVVTHRACWRDIGQDDDFEIRLGWDYDVEPAGVVQLSPMMWVDLDAVDPDENGLMPTWDISLGTGYWQTIPRAPDVETCLDPQYYTAVEGTGAPIGVTLAPGKHRWTARVTGGTATSWFDGHQTASFTPPGWTSGRTMVGVHLVGIHWAPGTTYPSGPFVGQPAIDPPPVTMCPYFEVTTW